MFISAASYREKCNLLEYILLWCVSFGCWELSCNSDHAGKEKKTLPEVLLLSHGICVADKQENVCSASCCKAVVKQQVVSETELSCCSLYFKAKT